MRGKILTVARVNTGGEVARRMGSSAARIGGFTAIALRWPRTHDNIPPATQAIVYLRLSSQAPIT